MIPANLISRLLLCAALLLAAAAPSPANDVDGAAPPPAAQAPTTANPAANPAAQDAARAMATYLDSLPEPNRTDWKRYFEWEQWGPALARGDAPDAELLRTISARFYGLHEGLEHPSLLAMRRELRRLLVGPSPTGPVGDHPALIVRINQRLIDAELAKNAKIIEDERRTGNWIAGAWVTGTAFCRSQIIPRLATYRGQAAIEVRVEGEISAPHTVAQKGAFAVHGAAQSRMQGVGYLYFDQDAVRASAPVFTAQTDSQIEAVEGPRLLRGIAARHANRRLPQGEREGAELIAREAAEKLGEELAADAAKANAHLADFLQYQTLLTRADLAPTQIQTGLLPQTVQVGVRFPQCGSAAPPQHRPLVGDDAFEIAVHESLVSGFTIHFLRSVWWSDVDFSHFQKELTGGNTNELLIGAFPERWAVRWDWRQPLQARVTPEYIEYQLAFSAARIDERQLDGGFRVAARFKPIRTRWGVEFRRVDAVVVDPQEGADYAPDDLALLTRKFASFLDETIFLDGLAPPAGGGWDDLASYEISNARLEEGWFIVTSRPIAKK